MSSYPYARGPAHFNPVPAQSTATSPHQQNVGHDFANNGAISPVDATAFAAHHGLQALQAAPPPGPSAMPLTQHPFDMRHDASYGGAPDPASPLGPTKMTRLRRACDMCSQRKVKCDESGPPCQPCMDLQVDCTFHRTMKRRGPPNRHAEAAKAAKRARVDTETPSPASPHPQNAAEALVAISGYNEADGLGTLTAETIAPWPVLELLVDDYFTYIHPLVPFPHEPSFRRSFQSREDRTNRDFLALLSGMIGCLVASFPRSARTHLKSQQSSNLFPRAITMINRCRKVAIHARGLDFPDRENLTVYDACTSYLLGLAAGYTFQWKVCRRFMGECLTFLRELGCHRSRFSRRPVDFIEEEMGKRLFWVILLGGRSVSQLGASHADLVIPPPTPQEPYPELPLEVDDECILPDQILPQPKGTISLIAGLNSVVKVYMTMNPLVSVELAYGMNSFEWEHQRSMLNDCLQAVKGVMSELPTELQLDMSNTQPQVAQALAQLDAKNYHYVPPAFPDHQPANDVRHAIAQNKLHRRYLQYEIQKANIYASQLATRSFYVERYLNLRDGHRTDGFEATNANESNSSTYALNGTGHSQPASIQETDGAGLKPSIAEDLVRTAVATALETREKDQADLIDDTMNSERELIVQNLLTVLASISQRNMEPNGYSLINKIRQVASTLMNGAPERKGPVAIQAEEYIERFVDILMQLEKLGPGGAALGGGASSEQPGSMTPQDEDQELRNWAALRDYQMRFAESGGFLHHT